MSQNQFYAVNVNFPDNQNTINEENKVMYWLIKYQSLL